MPLIPDVLLVDGLFEREVDLKAVVDGRFQFQERDSLYGVAIIELQMASNAMAGRPQHCCLSHPDQNSLDG